MNDVLEEGDIEKELMIENSTERINKGDNILLRVDNLKTQFFTEE